MTHETPGERWLRNYTTERDTLIEANAYDPADEKDSCGVGLVAQIDGTPRYEIITFNQSFHGRTMATISATALIVTGTVWLVVAVPSVAEMLSTAAPL